jgi:hypothetical protein
VRGEWCGGDLERAEESDGVEGHRKTIGGVSRRAYECRAADGSSAEYPRQTRTIGADDPEPCTKRVCANLRAEEHHPQSKAIGYDHVCGGAVLFAHDHNAWNSECPGGA